MDTVKFGRMMKHIINANNELALEVETNKKDLDTVVLFGAYRHEHMKKYDLTELSPEQADLLGMLPWDSINNRLIPLYLFNLLPDDMELTSICGEKKVKNLCSNDVRFGCTGYYVTIDQKN